MVNVLEGWRCPYCKTVYPKEYQAKNCATECVEVDEPEKAHWYQCEMCNYKCQTEKDALQCEDIHTRTKDKYYEAYLSRKNFEALSKAASVPGQMKLGGDA